MEFEIKQPDQIEAAPLKRPWWLVALIVVGLVFCAWILYSVVANLVSSPDQVDVSPTEALSIIGSVISLSDDEIIINNDGQLVSVLTDQATQYYNHLQRSLEIVKSSRSELRRGDQVVVEGDSDLGGQTQIKATVLTTIID